MKIFSGTDIGLKRSTNQDAYTNQVISENALWSVVCDGMGGVNGGNVASAIAIETAEKILKKSFKENLGENKLKKLINDIIVKSNEAIYKKSCSDSSLSGMGTTMVVIIIDNGKMYVAHVGDSRAYLKRDNEVTQITIDHSFVQDLVNRGEITKEEAKVHPHRNIITRSVGVHDDVLCDINQFDVKDGDVIISCSDGLSNYVSEEKLFEFIENSGDNIVDDLIKFAIDCGGLDNITVNAIKI